MITRNPYDAGNRARRGRDQPAVRGPEVGHPPGPPGRVGAEGLLKPSRIAQRRTGVAITSHTTGGRRQEVPGGTVGVKQLEILKAEGVDPSASLSATSTNDPISTCSSALAD